MAIGSLFEEFQVEDPGSAGPLPLRVLLPLIASLSNSILERSYPPRNKLNVGHCLKMLRCLRVLFICIESLQGNTEEV